MTLRTGRSSTCGDSFASPKTDLNNQVVVPTSAHAANSFQLKSPAFLHKDFSCPYQNQYFNASPSSHHQWWFMAGKAEVMERLSLGIKPQCSAWTQLHTLLKSTGHKKARIPSSNIVKLVTLVTAGWTRTEDTKHYKTVHSLMQSFFSLHSSLHQAFQLSGFRRWGGVCLHSLMCSSSSSCCTVVKFVAWLNIHRYHI